MIRNLLETYGYLALFVLVGVESVGIPLPGEAALLTASALAAQAHLSILGVILGAAAGGIIGDAAGYWIGRKGGLAAVRRYGRLLQVNDATLDRAHGFFQRHGGKTVFLGRFVSLLRMWAAVLAGVSRMPYGRFTLYNVAGGLCWAAALGSLGYLFGRSLPQLQKTVGQAGAMVALLLTTVVGLVLLGRWYQDQQDEILAWVRRQMQRINTSGVIQRSRARYPRAWTFLAQRFSPTEYLGLHLTLGLVLSLGALWLFAGISEDVIHHDPLTQFDLTVADLLHRLGTPILIELAKAVSLLGSPGFIAVGSVVICGVLLKDRRRVLLVGWIAALAGGGLLDLGLKLAFRRARPTWEAPYLVEHGWSFPSGHAMGSLVAYGMLTYVLLLHLHSRTARWAVMTSAVVLVLAIGFTRLFLGVHYFSDVVAGYAAGTVWLGVCISGLEVLRRKGSYPSFAQPRSLRPCARRQG